MMSSLQASSFLLILLFSFSLVSAVGIDNPSLPIVKTEPVDLGNNISVDSADKWDTDDRGALDSVSDLSHNWLGSIQGGSSNEYYHLNSSVYSYLIANVFQFLTGSLFDQSLNTTDDVQFVNVTVENVWANHVNATTGNFTDLYVSNNTLFIGDVKIQSNNITLNISSDTPGITTVSSDFFEGDGSRLRNINLSSVNQTATFEQDVTIQGDLIVNGTTAQFGDVNITGDLDMGGNSIFGVGNLTASSIYYNLFYTPENNFPWNVYDDGSNVVLNMTTVEGNNYFSIGTDGAFFQLYSNPNPSIGYLLATITETQGADTFLNFYEGGTGHNRFWDSGSARIGGPEGYLCSELTTDVDCDTPATGADLVVEDDGWFGGKLFSSDWSNVSINASQVADLNTTIQNIFEITTQTSSIEVTTSGGSGSGVFPSLNFTIEQITVTPSDLNASYRFEAVVGSTGNYLDKDRIVHIGVWDIDKDFPIDDTINASITSPVNTTFNITIKYLNNYD